MECPRCGGDLTVFTLEDARSVGCEDCQYAGVPTEFRASSAEASESWEAALQRFYEEQG